MNKKLTKKQKFIIPNVSVQERKTNYRTGVTRIVEYFSGSRDLTDSVEKINSGNMGKKEVAHSSINEPQELILYGKKIHIAGDFEIEILKYFPDNGEKFNPKDPKYMKDY